MTDLATHAAYEDQLRELLPLWRARLEQLHAATREQVLFGSQLGALLTETLPRHRGDAHAWISSLDPAISTHHIELAIKCHRYHQRHPELEDISQLTFTLSTDDASPTADPTTDEPPNPIGTTQIGRFTTICMRLTSELTKLTKTPIQRWDPSVKRGLKDMLRPLAEIYQKL